MTTTTTLNAYGESAGARDEAPKKESLDHRPDSLAGLNTGGSNVQRPTSIGQVLAKFSLGAAEDLERDRLLLHTCAFNARVFLEELHRVGEKATALLFGPAVNRLEGEDLSEQFGSLMGGFVDWCDDVERVARGEPVTREAQAKPEPSAIAAVPRKVSDVQAAEVELRETLRNLRITTQSLVRLTGAYRKLRHELECYREAEAERSTVPPDDDGCAGPFASMAEALGASS